MHTLTLFYDARCGLCSSVRRWLSGQPAYVRLEFIPYDSPQARQRCPMIDQLHAEQEIVVLSDEGHLWQGAGAWVMCLWALHDFREWSSRLASPAMHSIAKKVVHLISANRLTLSSLLHLRGDEALLALPDETSCEFSPVHR
jgi:predicted DCC family thiol-disulfide oxidoreductase YuxK